jgi:predicted metalloprotease
MRWTPRGRSRDLEDRRGQRTGLTRVAPIGIGGVLLLLVLSMVTGQDFLSMSGPAVAPAEETTSTEPYRGSPEEEKLVDFVSFVLDDTQQTWTGLLNG